MAPMRVTAMTLMMTMTSITTMLKRHRRTQKLSQHIQNPSRTFRLKTKEKVRVANSGVDRAPCCLALVLTYSKLDMSQIVCRILSASKFRRPHMSNVLLGPLTKNLVKVPTSSVGPIKAKQLREQVSGWVRG